MIQTIFKSEKDKTELVSFHIGNNDQFIESLKKNNMLALYKDLTLKPPELEILHEKKIIGKALLENFSNKSYEYAINREKNSNERVEFVWGK